VITPPDEVAVPDTVDADFDRFRDVMVADGTILRLRRFLADAYEPQKGEQGGARLHLLHNVTDQTIDRFSVTGKKAHDSTEFDTGPWLKDRLVLFDQAYFKYRRFALIDENDGYFVSRLKLTASPEITGELREWHGDVIPLEGEKIHDVVDDPYRQYIDVEVEAEFQRREYAGTQSWDVDDYHLYVTNLPREEFLPAGLATIYRCRWKVELLLRELKTQYSLDEIISA